MTPEQENEVIGMLEDYKRSEEQRRALMVMVDDYSAVGRVWRGVVYVAKCIISIAGATAAIAVAWRYVVKP